MKQLVNNFSVTGFVVKDAETRAFDTATVARFCITITRSEKNGDDTKRIVAFIPFEMWRQNENTTAFDIIKKGTLVTIEGYFKPEEWTNSDGNKSHKVTYVAQKVYLAPDKAENAQNA